MEIAQTRAQRLVSELTPQFLIGGGMLALASFVYMLSTEMTFVEEVLPERVLESLLLAVPAFGLIYAGYWLTTYDFSHAQLWQVGVYAVSTTLVAQLSTAIAIALFAADVSFESTFFLFVSTGTEGALLGVLIGVFAMTDALRRHGEALEIDAGRFRYLERAADVGYWEVQFGPGSDHELVFSDGVASILGVDPEAPRTFESYLEQYSSEDRQTVEEKLTRARTHGETFDVEVRLARGENPRWVHVVGEPVTGGVNGRAVAVRGVIQDVTDRKRYERRLEERNDQLDEFASVVSHDLRNPLTVAMARLELARETGDDEHLDAVSRAHTRMEQLIDDVLALARADYESLDPEVVSLESTMESCWEVIETGDARIRCTGDVRLSADSGRLKQLLENLTRNAIEHGGDEVTITVGPLDEGFYVEDDGPGIPADQRGRVFDAGYSTDGGTGFGLSIVEDVAEDHGWEVTLADGRDGGARFEVTGVDIDAGETIP